MRQHWCSSIGVDPSMLVVPRQVHGSDVAVATAAHAGAGATPGSTLLADADAIITNEPGIALMTTHADCLPLLIYAPRHRVIGAVHAGWRSTVANVAGETILAMKKSFGVQPKDIHAFIGPAICASCYEVGADVVDAWLDLDPNDTAAALEGVPGATTFDLVAANVYLLQWSGVLANSIERSKICTRCQGESWFSHRGQGTATGRFGAIIALDDASS
jgi:YfiH family protein